MQPGPIRDADLQAWVDDRLEPERRAVVEAWLAEQPERAAALARQRRANERLRAAYAHVLREPVPDRLTQARPRGAVSPGLRRIAAAVALLLVGGVAGWVVRDHVATRPTLESELVRPAAFAHTVYLPEVRHPVEVTADQEQHLVAWLSKRLGSPLRAPSLAGSGWQLVGGRLLPAGPGPAAQFMYEERGGNRLTLFIRHNPGSREATAFRFAEEGEFSVFYWVDGPLAYALTGKMSREALLPIAELVYAGLNP
ncbi:MAG: anti-sigma factor [Chromatiales bacterium]|nr:anti-sigma factor [Chromatiales bacterium]